MAAARSHDLYIGAPGVLGAERAGAVARMPSAGTATAAAAAATKRIVGPQIEKCLNGRCCCFCCSWWCWCCLFLLLKPILPHAAFSCAAACGRRIAAGGTVGQLFVHRCWTAVAIRTYLVRCIFVFASFFGLPRCRTSPHPSSISKASPAGFFSLIAPTHLNLGWKAIHFF